MGMRAKNQLAAQPSRRTRIQAASFSAIPAFSVIQAQAGIPKKKPGMSPDQQSEAFRGKERKLIDAGELSPLEADAALESVVSKSGRAEHK